METGSIIPLRVDEDLEKDFVKIPPDAVAAFVENAIKHGMKWMDGSGRLYRGFFCRAGWQYWNVP